MTRQETYQRIITIAYDTVRNRKCYFDKNTQNQLVEFVRTAVNSTMSMEDINNPFKVQLAENNMRVLCNHLCDRAQFERTLVVDKYIFLATRFSICPIWPFC